MRGRVGPHQVPQNVVAWMGLLALGNLSLPEWHSIKPAIPVYMTIIEANVLEHN